MVVSGTTFLGCSKGSNCSNGQRIKLDTGKALAKQASESVSWAVTNYEDLKVSDGDVVAFTYSSSHDL